MRKPDLEPRFSYETLPEKDWEINKTFGIYIHKKAEIGRGCKIGIGTVISEGVVLEDDVSIGNFVTIYRDTKIGEGSEILEQVNLGRPPEIAGPITRQLKERYPNLVIGKHCLIGPSAKIYRGTEIGNYTSICEFTAVREECRVGDRVVLAPGVTVNYGTIIGNNVRIMHSTHLTGGMIIEDDVFISLHVGSTNDRMIEGTDNGAKRWRGAIIRRGAVNGAGVMFAL